MDSSSYPQSRNQAFAQGNGSFPTTPLDPEYANLDPAFHATSVLDMYQNIPSGIGQDEHVTGASRTKDYGITRMQQAGQGSNQGSSPMNV